MYALRVPGNLSAPRTADAGAVAIRLLEEASQLTDAAEVSAQRSRGRSPGIDGVPWGPRTPARPGKRPTLAARAGDVEGDR